MQDQSTNSVRIPLFARDNRTVRGWTIIDAEDYPRVARHLWRYNPKPQSATGHAERRYMAHGRLQIVALHRFLLDAPDDQEVDHINGDGLDNRKQNLRLVSHARNMMNRRLPKNNKSGYKGVRWCPGKKKWRAEISYGGKQYHLGYFCDPLDAATVYNEASLRFHGEYGRPNVVA